MRRPHLSDKVSDQLLREIGEHLGVRYDANGVAIYEAPVRDLSLAERLAIAKQARELAEQIVRESDRRDRAERRHWRR